MNMMNMRKAYGQALLDAGRENGRIVALEADLGKSTMSNMFGDAFPERYFQMGIAEANMASTAAGLALTGHIAFMSTFAVFASGRAYDQIRSSVCIPNLNVKVCGSSAGLSDYGDGKTHQSVDDIAIMRALPNMKVLSPADAVETAKMVRAMVDIPGPCYIRVNRNDVPVVTDVDAPFEFGKVRLMREGDDAVIYATGYMVYRAMEAAKLLEGEGISVRVINVNTIKPLDVEGVRKYAQGVKAAVTLEEANIYGGLGSAVCETLACAPAISRVPVCVMGIKDTYGTSSNDYEQLLEAYGFAISDIADKVKDALKLA
ncbi:MAG: transketolase C-terminal domain-containing protein [Clostridia bacterium]|nr:transketolase C-terminal domain-containing protein [Clostridia bacterium]